MNGAWLRGFGRDALIALVCVTHVWPAWAQTSTLAQSPPYMATEPASNVFLMLDDSNSMSAHQLPRPSGITLVAGLGTLLALGLSRRPLFGATAHDGPMRRASVAAGKGFEHWLQRLAVLQGAQHPPEDQHHGQGGSGFGPG